MPGYPGNNLATLLYENKQAFFWLGETVPVNGTSVAFQLRRERGAFAPFAFSVELSFSGPSGAFEVDILTSDTDVLKNYVQVARINSGLNNFNITRYEMTNVFCKYVCLQMVALTNAVTVTAMVTR